MDGQDSTDNVPSEKRKREEDDVETGGNPPSSPARHPLWKTSLCSYFRGKSGVCSHGDTCRFAHSEEELRPRPDNSWDPTSERVKKLMKDENGNKAEVLAKEDSVLMTEEAFVDDADGSDPELRKCLVHLPRKWSSENLREFFTEQGIGFKFAKKKKGMMVGFISFESIDQLKSSVGALDGKTIGNKNIKVANVLPRSFEVKAQSAQIKTASSDLAEDRDGVDGNVPLNHVGSKERSAREVVTPLAHLSYAEQLEHKKNNLMQTLKRLTRNARKACPNGVSLPEWVLKSKEIGGLPCKFEGIIESPVVNGYRNKCEFSVGYSVQGKPTVGFMLGNFREGVTAVEEPVNCPNVSEISCKFASIFQEFLQQSSLPTWNRFDNTGFWRQLTVREGRNPVEAGLDDNNEAYNLEIMLMVQICSAGIDEAILNKELERMVQAFIEGANRNSPPLSLSALVLQDHKGISNVAPTDAPLRWLPTKIESPNGLDEVSNVVETRIHDHICNLKFSISPTAFFQVNTLAAEKLYTLAGDWADLGPDTLLFDVCCGTGTIGLTLAHRVGMVVGIEMNASAVSDAQRNAEINDIKNCRFVCSKAEDVMGSLLKEYVNVSQESHEIPNVTESHETETTTTEGNCAVDSEKSPVDGREDGNSLFECSESGKKDLTDKMWDSYAAQGGDSSSRKFKNVVAIVDPPRGGLHPTVIKALRTHSNLRRLVYISCNPESLVANAIELCTPSAVNAEKGNKNNGRWRNMSSAGLARHRAKSMPHSEPFQPVKAMAVDLFPHTPHCEMVMLLER